MFAFRSSLPINPIWNSVPGCANTISPCTGGKESAGDRPDEETSAYIPGYRREKSPGERKET
jgi:hypothetical protein